MIIGKIWDSEYPWDVRVEKVGGALTAAGHAVHLVCRNRRREPLREHLGSMTVHRMPPLALPARFDALLSFPAYLNPRWRRHALEVFRRERVDVVLCRDLPLAPLARNVARRLGRPLVLDIAEHYPGLLADLYNAHDFRPLNVVVRNPLLAAALERRELPRADHVLVVVEEMAERLVRIGVPRERISVVSNTPTTDRIALMARVPRPAHAADAPLRLVYLGKVERSRGLHVVLRALALSRADGHAARLDVFGDGSSLDTDRRLAARLGLERQVVFHGRRPYDEVLAALPTFDAGIIPHHATAHWNFTIQNKMFDYMAAGLPIIVSSMPPAARIARETGAGLVFRDRDPADLARLLAAFPGPEQRTGMGEAGRRAVRSRYHWDADAARLVAALERVVPRVA